MAPSLGEKRMRPTLGSITAGQQAAMAAYKKLAADLIDAADTERARAPAEGELVRLTSLAATHAEEAGMWLVKAATWSRPE